MRSFFKRRENKYLITNAQETELRKLLTRRLKIDQYGEYLVQNLYYDTENWDIIRECMEKPLYKGKLRLRFYNQYNPESIGFLELKNKFDGTTYKRRIAFQLRELKNRRVGELISVNNSQISREIGYFMERKAVSEKVYIAYKRIAYTDTENADLRITFDKDISFQLCAMDTWDTRNFDEYRHDNGRQILERNQTLMEIKVANAMPLWLAQALSVNKIFPLSFSKYGVCYTRHIFKGQGSSHRDSLKEEEDVA